MTQSQLVDNGCPIDLPHPQRILADPRCRRRLAQTIAHLAHGIARTVQCSGDLADAAAVGEAPTDLFKTLNSDTAQSHSVLPLAIG